MGNEIKKMADAEYFQLDAVNNSLLSHLKRSPAHAKEYQLNPPATTAAMVLGQLFHAVVLEPDLLDSMFHVKSDDDPATPTGNAGKIVKSHLAGEVFSDQFYLDSGNLLKKPTGKAADLIAILLDGDAAPDGYTEAQQQKATEYVVQQQEINGRQVVTQMQLISAKSYLNFLNAIDGKTIVTQDQFKTATEMAASVKRHPTAKKLLAKGTAEVTVLWEDAETGLQCKAKIDWVSHLNYLVDLKSTDDARLEEFNRSMTKYGYHRQNAMYVDGYEAVTGSKAKQFIFIVCEKKPPYAVSVFILDPHGVETGREEVRELLHVYKECKENDHWPAYSEQVETISLPTWYK